MTVVSDESRVDRFVDTAVSGETTAAIAFTIELLDTGIPKSTIIGDVMAPAQRLVGDRWQRGELSVADEHLASGVTESALYALSSAPPTPQLRGSVVVVCAQGDWHSIAGHMIAEQLQARGVATAFLGASTPADAVSRFLARSRPDALIVSCALPLFFVGVTQLADVAHVHGVPVIAGGRAFAAHPEWAPRIGAAAYARDVEPALGVRAAWRAAPPRGSLERTAGDARSADLDSGSGAYATRAFADLTTRFPAMANYSRRQLERTTEDLGYMVRFAAAALYVDDAEVFTEFLSWLVDLLAARSVPTSAVVAGLESLQTLPELRDGDVGAVLRAGLTHLA